ncbi:hypothetical protein L484_015634 [Morus notabilis]|uniref:SH3 domain-containing protein n=1 Tax=Morus notabilis TaxID=981085 RepID=W9QY31_9ROSA|nr:hypothetical protein L484_015634 [Morus notabilis]
MITGAPLEDARHLAQRYSRMRQEAETQAVEVSRRQARVRELPNPEQVAKLHAAEAKMQELKANMAVLGKEASTALAAVESQQQRLTFQRLVALVEGEKNYHLRIAAILGDVEAEMVTEKQWRESAPPVIPSDNFSGNKMYFLAEATHPFTATSEKELSLSVGDYVVVRKNGDLERRLNEKIARRSRRGSRGDRDNGSRLRETSSEIPSLGGYRQSSEAAGVTNRGCI